MRMFSRASEEAGTTSGYLHRRYAESFAEFGTPCFLPESEGWILKRKIPGFPHYDAMGNYPLFACKDWSALSLDLNGLKDELVSLSLVADPFGSYSISDLHRCFDVVVPFKEHYVVDLHRPLNESVSSHHRYYGRKALRDLFIERCDQPSLFLDEWCDLYNTLIARHHLEGLKAFSKTSFAKQLSTPGLVMFRALREGTAVGAQLWYRQGTVAYSHLLACNDIGYRYRASYALYLQSLEYFANEVRFADLGACAGVKESLASGLTVFKSGWTKETRPAYFCGRIFDNDKYAKILAQMGSATTNYFPTYRELELASVST